ncbi:MAG: glucose-6-phosphate dehydrogenase assembly protein OpcA [Akkermansiaceae bacterium]|nr:glucose-6-phosphate dehydrogenase assembly protein OpcA [Akkermansiaceae bacterium]
MSSEHSTTIPTPCPELGMEVKVGEIDHALRQLWEQDDARTNASLMNLVVFSEKPGALLENSAIVRELTREHACRAILTEVDRSIEEPTIRAWITAHCHLADGKKTVCCEQIAFHLTGVVTGRFRNTVFAHLNSDLPLILWWQGEISDLLSERLAVVIDRLIVDSSEWTKPAEAFGRIDNVSHGLTELTVHDHEWSRSWQFRLGIASLFDDPLARQALPGLKRIELTYHQRHRNCALQLLAWLAVQAGWQDHHLMSQLNFQTAEGQTIELDLKPVEEGTSLQSIRLEMEGVTATVQQREGHPHVERILEAGEHQASSLAPADPDSPQDLVGAQLSRSGSNSLFRKILPRFLKLLEALG